MRLTVEPVYFSKPRTSQVLYAPGLYEFNIDDGPSSYLDELKTLLQEPELRKRLLNKWNDELNPKFNLDDVVNETLELLQQTDENLASIERYGRFRPFLFKPLFEGLKGKPTLTSPLAAYKPEPIKLEYSFFRIYGIKYANDVFLVLSIELKTTLTFDPRIEKRLTEILLFLDANGITTRDFTQKGFYLEMP